MTRVSTSGGSAVPALAESPITPITFADSGAVDSFGRLRVSNENIIFDSKQLYDSQPLFWDDQNVSGSGTNSVHSILKAATTISVADTTPGRRVRQTFQAFNYQPGISQLIFMTASKIKSVSGIIKEMGFAWHGNNDGILLRHKDDVAYFVIRSGVSGSLVENDVPQSSWNIDKMDGSGPSGITIDFTKDQILVIDLQYLGVGRVRIGFDIGGVAYYCHYFNHANIIDTVYMSNPNLRLLYAIENDGSGPADEFDTICTSFISEGGQSDKGITRSQSQDAVIAGTADELYAALGIRLKATHLSAVAKVKKVAVTPTTVNDFLEWQLLLNPTVAGTLTFTDETNSYVQTAKGVVANTVTGGIRLDGGFASTATQVADVVDSIRYLGSAIDDTRDEIVLAVKPLSNQSFRAGMTWLDVS
jgi:hypothetical protein